MSNEIIILSLTAASIGFFHTLLGPDHYVPFIMMAKSGKWSRKKTAFVTLLCGIGHLLSSVILGVIGIVFGLAIFQLEMIETARESLAAWLLIIFGFTYLVYGIRRVTRQKIQKKHTDGNNINKNVTPWILFTIFLLGPCEPLIPILMYPAARESVTGIVMVVSVFSVATLGTMLGVVMVSSMGLFRWRIGILEKYAHALAGFMVLMCGIAIKFFGL